MFVSWLFYWSVHLGVNWRVSVSWTYNWYGIHCQRANMNVHVKKNKSRLPQPMCILITSFVWCLNQWSVIMHTLAQSIYKLQVNKLLGISSLIDISYDSNCFSFYDASISSYSFLKWVDIDTYHIKHKQLRAWNWSLSWSKCNGREENVSQT